MTDNISKKDKKDWENFISGDQKLPNKDIKYNKKVSLKTKSIDLHGYTLEQANQTIEEFIKKSYQDIQKKLRKFMILGFFRGTQDQAIQTGN